MPGCMQRLNQTFPWTMTQNKQDAEQAERRLLHEYKSKLSVDNQVYPDPYTFEEGWLPEETGRFQWPGVYICDIAGYLRKTAANDVDLVNRLINNYKEGKAHRYFTCSRVRQIFYHIHSIRTASPMCVLKADVFPSMNISKEPYRVWVMVTIKTPSCPGEEIKTAHCSCPAGLMGSCNHIAGLLFRVESEVKTGATKYVPTEQQCSWVVPGGPVIRNPGMWKDAYVVRDSYRQKRTRQEKIEAQRAKQNFQPFSEEHQEMLLDEEAVAQQLTSLLQEEVPNSVFILTRLRKKACTAPQAGHASKPTRHGREL
ncbi:uncharacterized protein [Littorina saxatilis]|uniref:SWIM-type domain-containing protein n=1 Tax=Littorina saxatilis TaxID=31220 RepID=A0AAN9C1U6_9CAEN